MDISLEKIIEIGVQAGVREALDRLAKDKEERRKGRYDRRLRNTKLILKNYQHLVIHCSDSVGSVDKLRENAVDILDEMDLFEMEDELYIESIRRSNERTAIIIAHIEKMLHIFKCVCERSSRPEEIRKYQVIYWLYISSEERTINQLSIELMCDPRTIYRDRDDAIKTISALIFGIDGLKLETNY
jgi:hypothetical protein